ncbi:hypothetical protein OKW96_11455 [Sphingobacterium sp. KU25419]|jgi:hypothetical protein|nr:hypothetical protein OKW96_11455 [Sphingobacterium sp. KU25419]
MKKRTLAILNALCLVVTLFVNYQANSGVINGKTMKIVSDTYHNLFTPAGYAFSIWGVIYLFLIGFVCYSFVILKRPKESHIIHKVGIWFIVSCVLNSLWIVAWLNDYIGFSVLIMILLLMTLLRIVVNIKAQLTDPPFRIVALVWWPFSLYSGWISVALIANIAAYLTKMKWEGWQLSQISWTIIMIVIAGLLYIFMTWKRNMREYGLVGSWALVAVAVANSAVSQTVYTTAIATAVIIAISGLIHGIKNFRGFGNQLEV